MTLQTMLGFRVLVSGALIAICLGGCSGGAPSRPKADGGTGAATGTGGRSGGDGGGGTGGATGSGGTTDNGGNAGTGSGGRAATGTGGAVEIGGGIGTGGRSGAGGAGAVGGALARGGASGAVGAAGGSGGAAICIAGIYDQYVLRTDGIALFEPSANNEHVILDTTTGLSLRGITEIQGGSSHGCALLGNGSVACWQTATNGNGAGQLGNGTTTPNSVVYRSTTVLIAPNTPLTNVLALATGGESNNAVNTACAVTRDGKLWCWGDLTWIVNKGTPLPSPYAQAITTDGLTALTGVVQATFARTGACAVVNGTPNSVWCWGDNAASELAQGDMVNRQYPVKVLELSAPTKVVMTDSYYDNNTICVLDAGEVRCWGSNNHGTVGINSTTTPITAPMLVVLQNGSTVLGGVSDIEPGSAAISALRTDGTLWNWGYGLNKYAGNYGLTNIVSIADAGGYSTDGPRFLTSDGVYHHGMTPISVNCGALQ